jgi:6-phosphogluconolactonase
MPMAVSPDRRFLYAASRSKPFSVHAYSINPATGALTHLSTAPTADSFPYISLDKTGRFLLGASYGGHLVSVSAVGADGRVAAEPLQVIPVGRNAHSIRTDESNKFVYVPTLGSDEMFQFSFDAKSGRLSSNTPAVCLMKPMTGPRHFVTSGDNRYVYVLSELQGTVTSFALDGKTGLLTEVSAASGLPPDTKLAPGAPRGAIGGANAPPTRNTDNDIWAADIHLTPNGRFLYISERTSSTLGAFSVDGASGRLSYLSNTPTERQPRGFAIDPKGRFLVATGEKSETISVYAIDQASGALKFLDKYPAGKGANWVEIVSFD